MNMIWMIGWIIRLGKFFDMVFFKFFRKVVCIFESLMKGKVIKLISRIGIIFLDFNLVKVRINKVEISIVVNEIININCCVCVYKFLIKF